MNIFKFLREKIGNKKSLAVLRDEERLRVINEAETKMLNTNCPIINGMCEKKCIHFEGGKIDTVYAREPCSAFKITRMPRCKLWKIEE